MKINEIRDIVNQVAPAYPVISIDLFGSYAKNEMTGKSDVDLLVNFDNKTASLFDLIGLKLDIQEKIGKKIDIIAGPIKKNSFLTIKEKVRIYEA